MGESFLPPVVVELGGEDTGAVKAINSLITALARIPATAQAATDALKLVTDSIVATAADTAEPLDALKQNLRSVATAMRATAKAAGGMDETATPAMEGVAASVKEMASSVGESVAAARTSVAELGTTLGALGTEARLSAASVTASAEESAAATAESSDAAAASADRSAAAMGETSAGLMKYATGLAAAGFGVFEAIKGATKFNTELTKLNTQAQVSKSQLSSLGSGVLALAGQVGENPDSLVESLYHVESNFASLGITGPQALNIVKIAAEGAQVGGANLVDVTNALTAAVASGIPGVQNMSQAMGALNTIVGTGDMTMQDLADAMGSGMVASVKGFGLSLNDVGAALATFGDNNIRGRVAATDLRMAVQALAQPVATAGSTLKQLGMTSGTLAADMRSGGLLKAMDDLMSRMKAAGITAKEQGQTITDLFGKKAGSGINILADQMDRLKSKYPRLEQGASSFAGAWQTASHTIGQEFNDLKAGLEALAIKIGNALLPPLEKVLGWVRDGVSWIAAHKQAVQGLAAVLGGMLVAALWGVVSALGAAIAGVTAATWWITGIAAALIYAYTHFKAFRTIVNDVAGFLKTVLVGAFHLVETVVKALISWWKGHSKEFSAAWAAVVHEVQGWAKWFDTNVVAWIRARVSDLVAWWKDHSKEISDVWRVIWLVMKTVVTVWWDGYFKPTLTIIAATWKVVWGLIRDMFKLVWGVISGVLTTAMHYIMNTIAIVLDLITGKWGKAWQDVKKLVTQGLSDVIHLITSATSGFGTLLYDAGKNVIQGLINGISSMIGGIGNTMSSITSDIRNFLPFSPAKKGPLSGSGSPDIAGRKIGQMVADGLTQSVTQVSRAGHSLAGAAQMAITGNQGLGGLALSASGTAAAAAGAAADYPPIIVQVDGRQLFKILQVQALRNGRRNPTTGLVYQGT